MPEGVPSLWARGSSWPGVLGGGAGQRVGRGQGGGAGPCEGPCSGASPALLFSLSYYPTTDLILQSTAAGWGWGGGGERRREPPGQGPVLARTAALGGQAPGGRCSPHTFSIQANFTLCLSPLLCGRDRSSPAPRVALRIR